VKPNFSESQLQYIVNSEILFYLYQNLHVKYIPILPNLIDEHLLCWDSAFYFDWLRIPPYSDNYGCNLFLQYKLSDLISNKSGKEYSNWNEPYFRFSIPYHIKNKTTGSYYYDFNQFDGLKQIANKGYSVFYTTNNVVYQEELFSMCLNGTILDEIPFCNVSKISGKHYRVTFTKNSTYFRLHSKQEEIKILKWNSIYNNLKEAKYTDLSNDRAFLRNFLIEFEKIHKITGKNSFESVFEKVKAKKEPANIENIKKTILISKYLKQYLDLIWFRIAIS